MNNTFNEVKTILDNGGYICWADESRPALYNVNGSFVHYIPYATTNRLTKDYHFVKWCESWGVYYVAKRSGARYTKHENTRHCERIAEELETYVSGNVYRCPECNEIITAPDGCDVYRCPDCGSVAALDEYEQLSLYDFLEDCLDIEYRIGANKELRSVQIMVACGGPNIYIDSASTNVELYWWGDRASYPISSDAAVALDEWAEELYQC